MSDRKRPRQPSISPPRPRQPSIPPPTLLEVNDYMVQLEVEDPEWHAEAFEIFSAHGFVLVKKALEERQCNELLDDCDCEARKIMNLVHYGNRGTGRYSFGVTSNTGSMLHVDSFAKHMLNDAGSKLKPLLDKIFDDERRPGFICCSGGGEFVITDRSSTQVLQPAIKVTETLNKKLPPPMLSVNFCVQDLTEYNGPPCIIPGTQMGWPTGSDPDDADWKRMRLCPVPAGTAIVRDIRNIHGGTPNVSGAICFMPSIEYVSLSFRDTNRQDVFPLTPCLPHTLFVKMKGEVRELCEDIAMRSGEDVRLSFKYDLRRGSARSDVEG